MCTYLNNLNINRVTANSLKIDSMKQASHSRGQMINTAPFLLAKTLFVILFSDISPNEIFCFPV